MERRVMECLDENTMNSISIVTDQVLNVAEIKMSLNIQ